MKIVFISSQAFSLINFRGELIREMVALGIQVYALAPDFDNKTRAQVQELGATPVSSPMARTGLNPLLDLLDILRLRYVLRSILPDLTFGYFIKPVIYGSIASWLAGVPRRISMIEGLGYVFIREGSGLRRGILRNLVSKLYRLALGLNEKVIFLNRDDIAEFVARRIVPESKAFHLDGIGIDLDYFIPKPLPRSHVTFTLVARMIKAKGIADFVEAARIIRSKGNPDVRFRLIGGIDNNPDSMALADLKRWVAEGLIEWVDHVADIRPWLAETSVFILPSYREGMSRSIQEAMALGRPVITTQTAGCRDSVVEGVNGFLIPVRDPQALASAMERFLNDRRLVLRMGKSSRLMAVKRFDVKEKNRQIMDLLFKAGVPSELQQDTDAGYHSYPDTFVKS
ncbi:MAG: glycosyltransferase family 4 protein [Leptospiraceae bacterium]|nr:glycosyltransferase family 4 protein [Leptospiraceae bacterium]